VMESPPVGYILLYSTDRQTLVSDLFSASRDPQYRAPPYSAATDPEPINTVLRVLSCGPEWGGAE